MDKLRVFVSAFQDDQLVSVPNLPFISKVNLATLPIGDLQNNLICEHRLYFTDLPSQADAEYLGFLTWRWNSKYNNLVRLENILDVVGPTLRPDMILCAHMGDDWFNFSCGAHVGMEKYLRELAKITGLNLETGKPGLWSNNFICHKSVYLGWEAFFRKTFQYFHHKYGWSGYDYTVAPCHESRKTGAFYERFACLYFSNLPNITIEMVRQV